MQFHGRNSPPGGDLSPPITSSCCIIFREGGSRAHFCSYLQLGHPNTQPLTTRLFPASQGDADGCQQFPSVNLSDHSLWLAWNHESCLETKNSFLLCVPWTAHAETAQLITSAEKKSNQGWMKQGCVKWENLLNWPSNWSVSQNMSCILIAQRLRAFH